MSVCSVVDSSKDYVAKALVNTVDHLGSVADKLSKFLDQKADDYSATSSQFSCIEQVLYYQHVTFYTSKLNSSWIGKKICFLLFAEIMHDAEAGSLERSVTASVQDERYRQPQAQHSPL